MKSFKSFLEEKKLTPAEKKKREDIAKAIEKDDPDMPMDKKMAIATATAKRVAEAKATYCGRCGTTHVPPSEGGTCPAQKKEELEDPNHGKVKAPKRLTSKRGGMLKQESVELDEDNYRVHATTHSGEKMTSGKMSKKDADSKHYNMTKATDKRGKKIYKSIEVRKEEVDEQDKTSHPQGSAKFYRGAMDKYKAKTPKKSHWDMYMDKRKKK